MIEAACRLHNLEGCPKAEYTSVNDFVKKLEAAAPALPVYDGELYLELHRGTLTAKQQIKKNNRMAENLLRMMELSLTRQAVASRNPADGKVLYPLWNTLLVNQFHDILPGQLHCPRQRPEFAGHGTAAPNRNGDAAQLVCTCPELLYRPEPVG